MSMLRLEVVLDTVPGATWPAATAAAEAAGVGSMMVACLALTKVCLELEPVRGEVETLLPLPLPGRLAAALSSPSGMAQITVEPCT